MKTKQYRIPTVSGYYSNLSTIDKLAVLHDAPIDAQATELQLHFNDLYHVLMHRLSEYAITDSVTTAEEDKMAALFLELVKTKRALNTEK
jgi:recombinational DNA repair protein RecR